MVERKMDISEFPPSDIRNFSIISHVDHGKTTLSDHLIASGGMLPHNMAGSLRALDYLPSEQMRGITIESSFATFIIHNTKSILVNLIDTPGHVDFSGKVTEALHLVDNGLIIVDAVEGVMAQTTSVIRQAIKERLHLILFINKVDRLIQELDLSFDRIRQRIERIIGEIHSICTREGFKESIPSFDNNQVIIGSALDNWAIDKQIAEQIGGFKEVMGWYKHQNTIPNKVKIVPVLNRIIENQFISPIIGQQQKYNRKKFPNITKDNLSALKSCRSDNLPLILVGKKYLTAKDQRLANVGRILSGTLDKEMTLFSNKFQKEVEINDIWYFRGKKEIEVDNIGAGKIVGLRTSEMIESGDILSLTPLDIKIPKLGYLHEPVVAISVEPANYENYEDTVKQVELLSLVNPGIQFNQNKETGELVISGVGMLQIELFLDDLQDAGFEIYTSQPTILEYYIPTITEEKEVTTPFGTTYVKPTKYEIDEGNFHEIEVNHNTLLLVGSLNSEAIEGFQEIFRRAVNYGIQDYDKIRGLHVKHCCGKTLEDETYEDTLVIANKIVQNITDIIDLKLHSPYFMVELLTQEQFLGNVSKELQRYGADVKKIETEEEPKIYTEIPVLKMSQLSDILRRVSDGHIIWKIEGVNYKKM